MLISGIAIAALVAAGFYFFLMQGEKRKRAAEADARSVAELTPRKLTHRSTHTCTLPPSEALQQAEAYLTATWQDLRMPVQTERELIAYTGNAAASKYGGVLNTPPEAMPLRIALRTKTAGAQTEVELFLDEDYGFQMFAGPAKHAFQENYKKAFALVEAGVEKALAQ